MAVTWEIVQKEVAGGVWNLHDSVAEFTGYVKITPTIKTVTGSILVTDAIIYMTPAADSQTLTLPDATASVNAQIIVKNQGSTTFTLAAAGSDTIDDESSVTVYEKESFTVHAYGTNWNIL